MEVLKIKDCDCNIFLSKGWCSIDQDTFIKKNPNGVFELIAVYFLGDYNNQSEPHFNLATGIIDLNCVSSENIKDALDVYGWGYDFSKKEIVSYNKRYDKEWSEYLLAEVLLNQGYNGDLTLSVDMHFKEVLNMLKECTIDTSKLANNYVEIGKSWLNSEYGEFRNKTTEMDIEEDSNNIDIRNSIECDINKIADVSSVKWNKKEYGYTLSIKFK